MSPVCLKDRQEWFRVYLVWHLEEPYLFMASAFLIGQIFIDCLYVSQMTEISSTWFKQYLLKWYQDIHKQTMFRIEQQDKTSYIKLSPTCLWQVLFAR